MNERRLRRAVTLGAEGSAKRMAILSGKQRAVWVPDEARSRCVGCDESFRFYRRRHHCRLCGDVFCANCSSMTKVLPKGVGLTIGSEAVRVCDECFALPLDGSQAQHEIQEELLEEPLDEVVQAPQEQVVVKLDEAVVSEDVGAVARQRAYTTNSATTATRRKPASSGSKSKKRVAPPPPPPPRSVRKATVPRRPSAPPPPQLRAAAANNSSSTATHGT